MPRRVHKFHESKIPSPNSGEDRVKSGSVAPTAGLIDKGREPLGQSRIAVKGALGVG
jgi:hypothetical protein